SASAARGSRYSSPWTHSRHAIRRGRICLKLARQKGPGEPPVPFDRRLRNLEDLCCLLDRQSIEVAQFDDRRLAAIESRQLGQREIDRDDVHQGRCRTRYITDRKVGRTSTSFLGVAG